MARIEMRQKSEGKVRCVKVPFEIEGYPITVLG